MTDYGHHISMKSRRCSPGYLNLALRLSLMTKLYRWKPAYSAIIPAMIQVALRLPLVSSLILPFIARSSSET
jgi:hypothetical protein